ncbi:MAG: RDD family protein [Clostridia bacterium]|nr:RDD family protein [Clostridia bacterium]
MIGELQRASVWKRMSAGLLDLILLSIIAVGVALIFSAIFGYDEYYETMLDGYAKYEAEYGVVFDIPYEEYEAMTEAERANFDAASEALSKDEVVMHAYTMMLSLTLPIVSFSLLFAYLILEFAVPQLFKNGQTVGKKIFGIAVMRTNGVKINSICLFIRTVLGKYTIETMIPVLIVIMIFFLNTIGILGSAILLLILGIELVLMFTTHNRSLIHDLLANTVTVDLASQMIFETEEQMLDYRKKLHAEEVARKTY